MTKWYIALVCLIVFLIPSNLFFKLDLSHAYSHGILIDYLIPKLYLSDLPIFAVFVLWFKELLDKKRFRDIKNPVVLLFLLMLSLFFARQLVTSVPRASLWFFMKLMEMSGLAFFLIFHREVLQAKIVWKVLAATLLFQAVLGVSQFYLQSSIFHSYLALGEVDYSHSIGLAKDSYFNTENILAYGTTAHPNILGGFLVIGGLLLFGHVLPELSGKNGHLKMAWTAYFLTLIWALFLTQSISASICLVLGVIFYVFKNQLSGTIARVSPHINMAIIVLLGIISLGVMPFLIHWGSQTYPDNLSFSRRDSLNQAATSMIVKSPFTGVGLNNFTVNLDKNTQSSEAVRFMQPAHNVAILWLAETGLMGVLLVGMAFVFVKGKLQRTWLKDRLFFIPILILLPILTLDHYLFSQQTGLLLCIFFLFEFQSDTAEAVKD